MPSPKPQSQHHHTIFFDRDDTLIHCRDATTTGDLGDPALVRLLPTVLESIQLLKNAGFTLVVISNQGGVARGRYTTREVDAVNAEVNNQLDGAIRAFYYCPYHPKGAVPEYTREHHTRKPAPGMLHLAAEDFDINLSKSWVVGDSARDCKAGKAVDARTILIPRPEFYTPEEANAEDADFQTQSLLEAAEIILRETGSIA